jgi:hypothetical protein
MTYLRVTINKPINAKNVLEGLAEAFDGAQFGL